MMSTILAEPEFSTESVFAAARQLPREGRIVLIEKLAASLHEEDSIGLREEDWPDTPENREKILALMEAVEPLDLSEEDEARISAVRTEMKAKSIEAMRQLMGLQP